MFVARASVLPPVEELCACHIVPHRRFSDPIRDIVDTDQLDIDFVKHGIDSAGKTCLTGRPCNQGILMNRALYIP